MKWLVIIAAIVCFAGFMLTHSFSIKGNGDSLVYHLQGCYSYNAVSMDNHPEDQWFRSEEDAISAGFRKANNCP